MTNINTEVLNVIKDAIELEINGRSFFEHAAEETQNNLGKKMFKKLARDEIEHLNTFNRLFTDVIGNEEWKKYVAERERRKSLLIEELKERIEKKGHYDLLQAQYDSVTNSGYWFDVAEFRMDGKY